MSMIKARSEEAAKLAARSLRGELSVSIEKLREQIVEIRAPIEAAIDYPDEYDDRPVDSKLLNSKLINLKDQLLHLLQGIERNRAFQEGVSVAIIGRPNVGKSSLLNALLHQQKAIVHEKPGTTRDLLEGYLNLGGYPLRIIDTAGIQGTDDPVEKEGIERSRYAAQAAKLLIVVLDGSATWSEGDAEIAALKQPDQGLVIVINKQDLEQRLDLNAVHKFINGGKLVRTAALKEEGIKELEAAISDQLDQILSSPVESPVIVSIRHEEIINDTLKNIEDAISAITDQPIELVSFELQNAWQKLGEISGATYSDALLDKIFSEFCLGK
jgi:tRNA modification GTPase